jgi:hypothetical protein
MKRIVIMLSMLMLTAQFLLAATAISVKGTVKNGAGAGIAGVKVTLLKNKGSSTTDATGAFNITGNTSTLPMHSSLMQQFQFSLSGNLLVISPAFENVSGLVDIFSSNGKKTASIPFSGNRSGKKFVTLPQFVSGLSIVKISIGAETITRTLMCLGNSSMYLKNSISGENTSGNFALTKQAAATVVDTLVASKTGYTDKSTTITSYSQADVAIVLDTAIVGTCPKLTLPAISAITYTNAKHPGPFKFKYMDLPNVTTKAQWECRRQEISAMAQEYLYGHLPPKPESVTGTVSGGKITVNCKQGSKTGSFTVNASGSGSILVIDFGVSIGGRKLPFPTGARTCTDLKPDNMISTMKSVYGNADVGICMAAAWGVGRVIDVLEQNPDGGIDAKKVMTTGCSTNGKVALIAGVFEPRVALCMPVESGAAGSCSWRVSSQYGHGDSNKDCQDITHLETNWTGTVTDNTWEKGNPKIDKLPFDQGELMALRAPGGMMVYNNFHD